MSADITPRLGLPWLMPAQAQKHVTVNESLGRLDALLGAAVISRSTVAQPSDPAEGDAYLLPLSPTGSAWSHYSPHDLTYFQDGAWFRVPPRTGLRVYVADESALVIWDGAAWTGWSTLISALANLTELGVGTAPDAANPFAAKLNAALWTARYAGEGGSGDLRFVLNKEGPADTLSLLFQTGWSGRAEIGLTGEDDLTMKVSSDGIAWLDALSVDAATGHLALGAAQSGYRLSVDGDAFVDALRIGTNPKATKSDLSLSANAVLSSENSLSLVLAGDSDNHRFSFHVGGDSGVTGVQGAVEVASIDRDGLKLGPTTSDAPLAVQGAGSLGEFNRTGSDGDMLNFAREGVAVGSISVTGSATAYNTSSDVRLKQDFAPAGDALSIVCAIPVEAFAFKAGGARIEFGFVAQRLIEHAPEVVTQGETEDAPWQVDHGRLTPHLVRAVQQLAEIVAELKKWGANG